MCGFVFLHARLNLNGEGSQGNQPFEIGSKIVLYNGELYNKSQIIKQFNMPVGSSDTVLLKYLLGFNTLAQIAEIINGMYAISVYDRKTEKLELTVDSYGQKPLFFRISDKSTIFGSQAVAVKESTSALKKEQLLTYLNFGFISPEASIFSNVSRVQPGETLEIDTKGQTIVRRSIKRKSSITWNDGRVMADYFSEYTDTPFPMGVTLSGGIDSSLVAHHYANSYGGRKLAFTVQVGDPAFSEAPQAKAFALKLGIEHKIIVIEDSEVSGYWKSGLASLDEPNSDSSIITTSALMHGAKKHVKCLLSGDGGDEIFGGYNRHKLGYLFSVIQGNKPILELIKLSRYFPNILKGLIRLFIPSVTGGEYDQRIKALIRALESKNIWDLYVRTLAIDGLFVDLVMPHRPRALFEHFEASNTNISMLDLDRYLYLVGNNLTRMDKISLGYGIECRSPLLDDRVSPESLQSIRFKSKPKLMKLHSEIYGDSPIVKKGFSYPIHRKLFGEDFRHNFDIGVEVIRENLNEKFNFDIDEVSERRAYNLASLGVWYSSNCS